MFFFSFFFLTQNLEESRRTGAAQQQRNPQDHTAWSNGNIASRARPLPSALEGSAPSLGHASRALQERPRPAAPRGQGSGGLGDGGPGARWRPPTGEGRAAARAVSSTSPASKAATRDVHVYVRTDKGGIRGKRVGNTSVRWGSSVMAQCLSSSVQLCSWCVCGSAFLTS